MFYSPFKCYVAESTQNSDIINNCVGNVSRVVTGVVAGLPADPEGSDETSQQPPPTDLPARVLQEGPLPSGVVGPLLEDV